MGAGESTVVWGVRSSPEETPKVFVGALREAPSNAGNTACQPLWRASFQPARPSTSREGPVVKTASTVLAINLWLSGEIHRA